MICSIINILNIITLTVFITLHITSFIDIKILSKADTPVFPLDDYQDVKRDAKVVSIEEIRENNYNLNIRRYADTSPPPEQYDVRAILNGGIPVSEVNDEYIQETLQGMDVSSVFIKKDNEYYEFKPEIETKEQIRDHLHTDEQAIVSQFERWWDKYKVSLNEIEIEVKKSEEVMKGYLKELGYE